LQYLSAGVRRGEGVDSSSTGVSGDAEFSVILSRFYNLSGNKEV